MLEIGDGAHATLADTGSNFLAAVLFYLWVFVLGLPVRSGAPTEYSPPTP